jgi:hypothetical protein
MKNDCNCQPSCCCPSNEEILLLFKNASELHNEDLMYIATLQNYLDLNFKKSFKGSQDFCVSAYPTINVLNIITEADAEFYFNKIKDSSVNDNWAQFADFLKQEGLLTNNQWQFYKQIINTVLALQDARPVQVTSAMIGLQNAMLSRTDLRGDELAGMYALSNGSVAIFKFWANALNDQSNPWWKAAQGSNLPAWLNKGLRDLGGFIVGAVIGTAIGGPAVGAAGGTLVGGACSGAK